MRLFWMLPVLTLVACESVESEDIATDAMSADINVVSLDGASARAGVTPAGGGKHLHHLCGADGG